MAQLYGSLSQWQKHESPDILPAVSDLGRVERIKMAFAQLKRRAEPFGDLGIEVAEKAYATDPNDLKPNLRQVHYNILETLAGDTAELSAYQLGRALSDTCWLPGAGPDGTLFLEQFSRHRLATLQSWMTQAGPALPLQSAAVAARSLLNWQDWADVNVDRLRDQNDWNANGPQVTQALLNQGRAWRALLSGPQSAGSNQPSTGAWIRAGESALQTARTLARKVLLHFWPVVVIILAVTGALLYLAINNAHGTAKFWTSLVTVAGAFGVSGATLRAAGQSAAQGVEQEVWNAATLVARAWEVTWLPTLPPRLRDRYVLYRRGVALPQRKKGLESVMTMVEKEGAGGAARIHTATPLR
jgi:hypothetical protein